MIGQRLNGYLSLCRVSNLPTVWTNVLAASVLAVGHLPMAPFLLVAIAMSLFYAAGMVLNDLCDLDHDRTARPQRPLPSGAVPLRDARILTRLLFAGGLLLLAFVPYGRALFGALLLIGVIILYDLKHKGNPFSVFLMASCRLLIYMVTALALSGRITGLVIVAGCLQFIHVTAISMVARFENKRPHPFPFPVIPVMIAGISLLDGIVLASLVQLHWIVVGIAGFLLTTGGQRFVRGD